MVKNVKETGKLKKIREINVNQCPKMKKWCLVIKKIHFLCSNSSCLLPKCFYFDNYWCTLLLIIEKEEENHKAN